MKEIYVYPDKQGRSSTLSGVTVEKSEYTSRLCSKVLYVTEDSKCWKLTTGPTENVPELESSHEEADTRIIVHAKHANCPVVVHADDTDVPGVHSQEMSGTEVPLGWVAIFELRYRDGFQFLPFGIRMGCNFCHQV